MLRDEIYEASAQGGFAMLSAERMYKATGSHAGEHLSAMWRRGSPFDHVGLVTDAAFYVVRVRAMGMFYSLDTEVRWDDAASVTWESIRMPPNLIAVVAKLEDRRGTYTYFFGTVNDPMEMAIEERRAEQIVSMMNQLIAQRRHPRTVSSDPLDPANFTPEAMNRLIPGAGDFPDDWFPDTGPDPGDRSSGEEFTIGESQVVARIGMTVAYVVYRGPVDALPTAAWDPPEIVGTDRYILYQERPGDPVDVIDDAGSFAELLTGQLTGALLTWVAPNARRYLGKSPLSR